MDAAFLLHGLGTTVLLWVAAMALAAALAVPVAAARRSRSALLRTAAGTWITVWRAVPPLVWLFILFFGITIGGAKLTALSAAIVGLGLVGSAYVAESYRAGLESVGSGQREAISALAIGRWVALRSVILPQSLPVILAGATAFGINLVKDTALASLIGVQEMTFFANYDVQRGSSGMLVFFLVGLAYVALSVPLGIAGRLVQNRFLAKVAVA